MGDIVGIRDDSNSIRASFIYDAWGFIGRESCQNSNKVIAELIPFRYRGYVYDNETGLYYLNSRYYDPVTSRFVNQDDRLDSDLGIIGYNMFSYCGNDCTGKYDPYGTDAIILQYGDAALGFGHMSAMVQDSIGRWWWFYWGTQETNNLKKFRSKAYARCEMMFDFTDIYGGCNPIPTLYSVKAYLELNDMQINSRKEISYSDGLTGVVFLKGDFTASLNYYCTLVRNSYYDRFSETKTYYRLLTFNCKDTTLYGLSCSETVNNNWKYWMTINHAILNVIPNSAFDELKIFLN